MARAHIEAVICALPMPALLIDEGARIAALNDSAKTVLGEGLTGRHYTSALRQPSVIDAIERCLQNQKEHSTRYTGSDGRNDIVYELRCAYVDAPEVCGALLTFTDVTDLEQTSQIRSDFVANVSHELRTPLTAVIGFIETLQGPARNDPPAQTRFLDIMANETARMNRLIDKLLTLSRVEVEARRRPGEHIEITPLMTSIVHTLGRLADVKNAALTFQSDVEGLHIPADADQLRQVFTNLIENALKYGGAGVAVTVTLHPPAFEPRLRCNAVRICVRDTGPGFEAVHIARLTERFYRIDSHRSREMGGTGLGLAIVKHIVGRHRGRLDIQSEVGQGSEFNVFLPTQSA